MKDLAGKVVLITGASTGIGAAAARAFARAGGSVAVHYHHSRTEAEQVVADVRAAGAQGAAFQADLSQAQAPGALVEAVLKHFGRIDVLINNAGSMVKRVPVTDITPALFDEVVHLNVRSALLVTSAAVPAMRRQGGGAVINVTSVAARHGGGPGASLYAGSKGFISTMTRGLAKELVKDRIRVNAVAPGVIVTPFHDKYSTPEQMESFRQSIPMQRLGTPDECAGAFLYLASEAMSGYVTGQILEVNGGQYMP